MDRKKPCKLISLHKYLVYFLFSEQLRNINETSAVYMPYKPVQRYIGHQSEEMERLSSALRKHGIDCGPLQKAYENAFKRSTLIDASDCTHVTHRCHHAAHAYTGIPCSHKSKCFTRYL